MASTPMRRLWAGKRFKLYWAERSTFLWPGLHLWTGKRHVRLLAIPATRHSRRSRVGVERD